MRNRRLPVRRISIYEGLPPPRSREYRSKARNGKMYEVSAMIDHGEFVEIPSGSVGKFKDLVEARGLRVIARWNGKNSTAYVVNAKWWADHPEC